MIIFFLLPASLDPVLVRKYPFSPSSPLWKELLEVKGNFYITKSGKRVSGLFSGPERMEKDPFLLGD
jgi:hypothetical protein